MIRSKSVSIFLIVVVSIFFVASIYADVPNTINYQGRLTDDAGQPIDGSKLMKFKIYGSLSGNDSLWSSNYRIVQINDGLFNYELGHNVPLPEDLFVGAGDRYLGITVDTDDEITPRTQFIAEPYAIRARTADSLNGAPYVRRTGDTISGNIYFDGGGVGKVAELLLYSYASAMNFYQSGAKRITLESEFGTLILRGQDNDLSLWMSGGEDVEEGGSIRLYNSDGSSQIYLDGDRTGDASVQVTDNAINADEMLNEPGIATGTLDGPIEVTSSSMVDLTTVDISIPAAGYVHVTAKLVVRRTIPSPTDECECGAYLQIDTTAGGNFTIPYYSFVSSWVTTNEETTPYVERTFYLSSPGTYEFRLEGRRYSSSEDCIVIVYHGSITAVYYPTYYGVTK
jgi:hypothetical protein